MDTVSSRDPEDARGEIVSLLLLAAFTTLDPARDVLTGAVIGYGALALVSSRRPAGGSATTVPAMIRRTKRPRRRRTTPGHKVLTEGEGHLPTESREAPGPEANDKGQA